ncbi:DUF1638 domain-containing protein [Methanomassiliicoccus luminyensis]|jgi:hypothetical protein|uniref:DUF1638 domain-containing protein n=1 Tax=Methanomassiliicoccus luminyensis TaxID=1080712 RepID=UPI0003766269|nr:DUF1638 domain-containing protein [Methanomassiliicoccus luminyensis]
MRIGILACEILKKEIEQLTAGDPEVVHREYLEFFLHDEPEKLREMVLGRIDSLIGKIDVLFLGYAHCQTFNGLPGHVPMPTVMLEVDDCVAAMLGPFEYCKQKEVCAGTWFSSPGWAEKGMDAVVKELHISQDLLDQGMDGMYFAKIMFQGYSRCLFIDTGVGDRERYEAMSKDFAEQLSLRHESVAHSPRVIAEAWERTKKTARELA